MIHAPEYGALEEWRDGVVLWDASGRILSADASDQTLARHPDAVVDDLRPALILPGLVDAHTHLPQYPAAGIGAGAGQLLPWLERYIFPLERRFNAEAAENLAPAFFRELARNGTTAAGIYLAVYEESADVAFRHADASGLRLSMGQMMMDDVTYADAPAVGALDRALEETDRLCARWHGHDAGRIRYALSPRFAVACSADLMRGAAEIANRHGAGIQTHLAENAEEIRVVARRFPEARDYTDVYARAGLLTPRTVVGHAIHLSHRERAALAGAGVKVAHCPTSNLFLGSGLMAADALRVAGVTVCLGSDVAAGPELSMWRVMRAAIETRNARAALYPGVEPLEARHALHMATAAGAAALGWGDSCGVFAPGREADILVADPAPIAPPGLDLDALTTDEVLALCIFRGDARLTRRTLVRGRAVWERDASE